MALKIINAVLIVFAVLMGIKQGWAMTTGKQAMLDFFGKWQMDKQSVMLLGLLTLLSVVLILVPKTFVWGNFLMAAGILFIICLELYHQDWHGALVELPFFLLNLVIICLHHPLEKSI
jgi:hypothetical protein